MKTKDSIEEIKNKVRKIFFLIKNFWNLNFSSFQRLDEMKRHASTVYFGRIINTCTPI